MTDIISNAELLERYAGLCAAADRHAGEGWRSAHEDGMKRGLSITAEQLDRFADMAIGGIGFEPAIDFQGVDPVLSGPVQPVPAFTKQQTEGYQRALRERLENTLAVLRQEPSVLPREWLKTVRYDGVVGGASVVASLFGEKVPVSLHTVRVSTRAFRMRRMLGHIPRGVLEIGGGHGRFLRDLLVLAPGIRVVACDLVFNLLLTARYLTRLFGDDVHLAWDDDVAIPHDAKIVLLPPWRLGEIPFPVEVCCNFLSFHHMEEGNVRYYADRLVELDVAAIFHQNRLAPLRAAEVTLGNHPYGPGWTSMGQVLRSMAQQTDPAREKEPIKIIEELLVHERHAGRYDGAYRERLAYERLLEEGMRRRAADPV